MGSLPESFNIMIRFTKCFAFILLTTQVYSTSFEDFKNHVLGEIKTLKEDNVKKDQEIASLKRGREELITVIQNNEINMDYLKYYSTLMNVPQTCQELGFRGVDRSGSYPINPDGSGSNGLPITVSCDFPSGKTILGKAKEIEVNRCDTILCFPHEVETDFPQSQITALMDASMTCSQELTYSCISAPWKVYGKDHLLIIDRDGGNHTLDDFGSSENCNSITFNLLSDSVTITNKNILPINGFRYGPLPHDNQKVTMKIGPLVCTPPEEPHKTTLMLKIDEIEANLLDLTKLTGVETKLNKTLKELRDEIEYVKEDASNNLIQHIQILKSNMKEEIQASTAVFDTKFNEIENAAQDDLMNELEQRVETQFNETLR